MVDKVGISMLRYSGFDVDGALERFCNNTELYEEFLLKFVDDPTFNNMMGKIRNKDFVEGYNDCHALKGVTGNMGFTKLYECCNNLCKALKAGIPAPIAEQCMATQKDYDEFVKIIKEI